MFQTINQNMLNHQPSRYSHQPESLFMYEFYEFWMPTPYLSPHLLDRHLLDLPQAQRLARQPLQVPEAAEALHGSAWGNCSGPR